MKIKWLNEDLIYLQKSAKRQPDKSETFIWLIVMGICIGFVIFATTRIIQMIGG